MKVYLITTGEYSDYRVKHVTLDKEKAERYCEIIPDHEIEEYELDDFDAQRRGYTFLVSKDACGFISVDLADEKEDTNQVFLVYESVISREIATYVKTYTYEMAKRIAQDRFAMYEYREKVEEAERILKEAGLEPEKRCFNATQQTT